MRLTKGQRVGLVVILMVFIAGVVVGYVMSGKNGTLVRNSLHAKALPQSAFNWQPGDEPSDFILETEQPPAWFSQKLVSVTEKGSELVKVEAAIRTLHRQPFVGGAIQKDLQTTWRLIEDNGRGYCADYSKLFTALMLAEGLPVREWGLGHTDFGSGHTFNEVYFTSLDKWVFVDSFNGMLIEDRTSGQLLSVLEFREHVATRDFDDLVVIKLTDKDSFFQTREEGLNYYARSSDFFYLIWGNDVFSYDSSPLIREAAAIARPLERFAAILTGYYPGIRLLETDTNAGARAEVKYLGLGLYLALAAEILLSLYLIRLLWLLWRQRKQ